MTIGRVHKQAVGGYGATQPKGAGHEAKAPKGEEAAQPTLPGGAKYHKDTFEGAKHCKGGQAAEDKKGAGHQKEQPGQVTPPGGATPEQGAYPTPPAGGTPPVGGTLPEQGAYPTTPPTGGTPPTQGTPPAGEAAEGGQEQTLQQAVESIADLVQQLIEALGGQAPEQQVPGASPNGNTGIVPPGAVQGTPLAQAA